MGGQSARTRLPDYSCDSFLQLHEYSDAGDVILAGYDKGSVTSANLVSCHDGKVLAQFPEHRLPLRLGRQQTALLRNTATSEIEWWSHDGKLLRQVAVPRADRHMHETAVSPDEQMAAVFPGDGTLQVCSLREGESKPRMVQLPIRDAPPLALRCLRWSPDSKWLALGLENRPYSAWLVEAATG